MPPLVSLATYIAALIASSVTCIAVPNAVFIESLSAKATPFNAQLTPSVSVGFIEDAFNNMSLEDAASQDFAGSATDTLVDFALGYIQESNHSEWPIYWTYDICYIN